MAEDMTAVYNTPLSADEEPRYAAWALAGGQDPVKGTYDYDLKGLYKQVGDQPLAPGHMSDAFKKPNHPTFSKYSQYHGQDGEEGGDWQQHDDKTWSFTPGASNMARWGQDDLKSYFDRQEPGNRITLPAPHAESPSFFDKLTGTGTERYQLWPERIARGAWDSVVSGVTAPMDALTGKLQVNDPETNMPTPEAVKRAWETTTTAVTGGLAGAQKSSAGVFGGRLGSIQAGEKATAKMEDRALAMDALERGADPRSVRKASGWYKDSTDGHMKFYIPDDNAVVMLPPHASIKGWVDIPKNLTMGDVLHHPDLYKHYPEFKDIKIEPVPGMARLNGTEGAFDDRNNVLYLSPNKPADVLSIITHEIQHAIQKKEQFPGGANVQWFLPKAYPDAVQQYQKSKEEVFKVIKASGIMPPGKEFNLMHVIENDHHNMDDNRLAFYGDLTKEAVAVARQNPGIVEAVQELKKLNGIIKTMKDTAIAKYRSVAGEVEARNAEKWLNMNPELREQAHPEYTAEADVPLKSRIVLPRDENGNVLPPVTLREVDHDPFAETQANVRFTPDKFRQLADQQRGAPEQAMLRVQKIMGGGVLSPVVEHAGDLVHRMSEFAERGHSGYGNVLEKVDRVLKYLKHPYGFEKEMDENIRTNAGMRGIDPIIMRRNLDAALRQFGAEHAKLPAHNEAHRIANQVNVDIGNKDFRGAIEGLEKLKSKLGTKEEWDRFALQKE